MSRLIEASLFLSLAAAIHVGAFTASTIAGDGTGGGQQGVAQVTLAAASGSVAEMVQKWDRRPETLLTPAKLIQPDINAAVQPAPTQDHLPVRATLPQLAALPTAPQRPQIDTRLPAMPVTHQPPQQPQQQPQQTTPDNLVRTLPDSPLRPQTPRKLIAPQPPKPPVADAPTIPRPTARPKARPTPRAKPKPAQPLQKAQTAAGSGNAPVAGQAKPQKQTATLSSGQQKKLLAGWGARIKRKVLRRKTYPRGTTATGTTSIRISVSRTGQLAGLSIRKSSGNQKLDQAALRAVKRAGRLPKAPKGLTKTHYGFTLAMTFSR